mgnify:CR=1 FL=1
MGNATNETTKKTNWLDAIKAQFKRIIWPTKEEAARRSAVVLASFRTAWSNYCCIRQSFTSVDRRNYFIITEG